MQRQVSLWHATSFAPLSKLTHLDLVRMIPPANLTAFLLGDASITLVDPDDVLSPLVRDEIEAGLSPHLTLECLRISDLPRKALYHFGDFAVWRKAYDAYRSLSPSERALRAAPRPPESTEECFQFQNSLYNLASNSRKLPSLRLVILDIVTDMHDEPYGALRQLVEEGALKGVSETFPLPGAGDGESYAATGKLALLFGANAKVPEEIIARIGELDDRWQGYVADEDEHWQLVHQGKHDLIQLWNDSRKPANGHDPIPVHTEIRIAADRYQFLSSGDRQREFVCQASSLEALEHAEGSPLSSQDVGIWADPDVFELVKTMPWLSYIQLNEMGCCCWLGGLPRDSNPNPGLSRQKGEEPRLVHPSIVLLDENKLNETGRDEVRARRAQEEEEEEARKRQRTEAAAAEQADAAPI
ncbi:hypothetical protein PSEUBRA_004765 [Kalmanozyma brasiliensis GHG001]|uniref:Uncharacterized protein n=1 Tax=Kalmanozyma brasiliensis (strain GHG001) TaxID=1365824 RepID=V5E671_KALBG|nr:uncharacterized protein PSEUBRA_004765 [Kalmanozyma brasiliensis GHG001]EST05746.1 hypothetical protein PSEUBRA_004765 [Kalmanozyma brasiliensis GHG001]